MEFQLAAPIAVSPVVAVRLRVSVYNFDTGDITIHASREHADGTSEPIILELDEAERGDFFGTPDGFKAYFTAAFVRIVQARYGEAVVAA